MPTQQGCLLWIHDVFVLMNVYANIVDFVIFLHSLLGKLFGNCDCDFVI